MKRPNHERRLHQIGVGLYLLWALGLFAVSSSAHPEPPWWYVFPAVLPFALIPVAFLVRPIRNAWARLRGREKPPPYLG